MDYLNTWRKLCEEMSSELLINKTAKLKQMQCNIIQTVLGTRTLTQIGITSK